MFLLATGVLRGRPNDSKFEVLLHSDKAAPVGNRRKENRQCPVRFALNWEKEWDIRERILIGDAR